MRRIGAGLYREDLPDGGHVLYAYNDEHGEPCTPEEFARGYATTYGPDGERLMEAVLIDPKSTADELFDIGEEET